jgi:hypothetical protein
MKEQELKSGTLVKHQSWGVGEVIELQEDGRRVIVDFLNRPQESIPRDTALRSLSALPSDGLEARLWVSPGKIRSWVQEAPLKLIAATLVDLGKAGKAGDIKTKLQIRVLQDVKWDAWWKRVRPVIGESSLFRIGKSGSISLLANVESIPEEPLGPPVKNTRPGIQQKTRDSSAERMAAWFQWLMAGVNEAPPNGVPPKELYPRLETWPEVLLERAFIHFLSAAEGILEKQSTLKPQVTDPWLEAVSQIALRWLQCMGHNAGGDFAKQMGITISRLYSISKGDEKLQTLVVKLVTRSSEPGLWRTGLASGFWIALQEPSSGPLGLLSDLGDGFNKQIRVDFLQEIALGALGSETPGSVSRALNRLLSTLDIEEQTQVLQGLIVATSSGGGSSRGRILDFLSAMWETPRISRNIALLRTITIAGLLSQDVENESRLVDQVATGWVEAIDQSTDDGINPTMHAIVTMIRSRFDRKQEETQLAHEAQRVTYESRLMEIEHEEHRLRQQVRDLQAQLGSGNQESKLDIRRDMLLVIGETLQIVNQRRGDPEEILSDVESGLSLAVMAGEAEELGRAGDRQLYDPRLHQSEEEIPIGGSIVISAPGIVVKSGSTSERILIKAKVTRTPNDN